MQAAQVHIFPTAERVPRYFVLQSAVPPRLSCVQPLVPTTSQLPSKRVEALARAIECAAAIKTYSPMNYLRQMSYGILPEFERPHERGIKPEPTVPQAVPDIHVDQRIYIYIYIYSGDPDSKDATKDASAQGCVSLD